MSSIRRFLVVVLLATITLVNFLAALHGYQTSMEEANRVFDRQLDDIAAVLAMQSSAAPASVPEAAPNAAATVVYQIWNSNRLEHSSGNVPAEPIGEFRDGYQDVNFSGYRWRALARQAGAAERWLIVAERTDIRFALAESIIVESVLPIILSLPLLGILIWIIVGHGLRPLRSLANEMGAKRSDDLSPIGQDEPRRELRVLVNSINDLLRRLADSFNREKRFAADAAHELRTPISVLKVQLHNLGQGPAADDPQLASLASAVERMGHSVEQILTLYRTSPDQFAVRFMMLDLARISREVIASVYPQTQARGQQIELVGDNVEVFADEFCLQALLTNLIDNASKYGGVDARIRVSVTSEQGVPVLLVEDSGPGIPPAEREQVFERFYRIGGDRHGSGTPGSGLGLAIVQHIVEILGAQIELRDSSLGSGLGVRVLFAAQVDSGRMVLS